MSAREQLERAGRSLEPLQQGSLDGLCGLYAVINAVRLALYPDRHLTRRETARLFSAGLVTLRNAHVIRTVLAEGMHEPVWTRVSAAVVTETTAITGRRLVLRRIPLGGHSDAFAMIRLLRHAVSAGNPVLLNVEGRLDHWTVVYRFSRTRLTLFDSSGHRWFLVRSIGLAGKDGARPYTVPRRGLVALHPADE